MGRQVPHAGRERGAALLRLPWLVTMLLLALSPANAAVQIRNADIATNTIQTDRLAFTPIQSTDTLQSGLSFFVSSGSIGSGGLRVSSTVTAVDFVGDGSRLTGVSSATYTSTAAYAISTSSDAYWNGKVDRTGDTMSGQFTMLGSSISFVNPGSIENPNYVQFNTAFNDGTSEGRLQWNVNDGTLEIGMPGGNVNLQIGQEHIVRVKNNSGVDILNGHVVYQTGESGNKPTVALAYALDPASCNHILGMATEDIDNGDTGYVTIAGLVRDVNTNTFSAGDCLYLGTTTGTIVNQIPAYPAKVVSLGKVVTKGAGNGSIQVAINQATDQINVSSVTATKFYGDGSNLTKISTMTVRSFFSSTWGQGDIVYRYTPNHAVTIKNLALIVQDPGTGSGASSSYSCGFGGAVISTTVYSTSVQGSRIESADTAVISAGQEVTCSIVSTTQYHTPVVWGEFTEISN